MSSTLEHEDLENVQLVRMEDVQPSRERAEDAGTLKEEVLEIWDVSQDEDVEYLVKEEELETCIVDDFEYDNECVVEGNDEDSNIGSMVSVAEDMGNRDDGSAEIIVPEALSPSELNDDVDVLPQPPKPINAPQSWPTLEILPGGVINHLEKVEDNLDTPDKEPKGDPGVMVYACAKCPERFQYLFNLVKHVRTHEIQHVLMHRPKPESDVTEERVVKSGKKHKIINRIINKTGEPIQLVRITKPAQTYACLSPIHKNNIITKVGRRKIVKVPKKSKS